MMLRKALLAATILAMPVAAMAQPVTGLYVAGGIGGNYLMDTNAKLSGTNSALIGSG
jgi:OOP family OmpA-OmpF porin